MRKMMMLAMMIAMALVVAAPTFAQNEPGNYGDQYNPPDLYDQVCEIASQEEAQRILDDNPSDPHNLDSDGDGVACNSEESADGNAKLTYELAVEGQCATDTTFFGQNNLVGAADYVGTVQLTDPDGDGVYAYSEEFPVGSGLDNLSIDRGTGTESVNSEFFRGPVPGEPVTTIKSFDPITLEEDTTLSASASCEDPVEPNYEEATLDFELAVEGHCPAETNFFAGMNTSHGYSVPLADPDGDGVYTGSMDFAKGVELLEIALYEGAGIQEGPYGQIPVGDPEEIQNFGNLTVERDETFSATTNCEEPTEPPEPKNPGKNGQIPATEKVVAGLKTLPDTGGMSLALLGGGVLLIGSGLAARKIIG